MTKRWGSKPRRKITSRLPNLADLLELRRPQRYAVRVKGEGLRTRGIHGGDILVVNTDADPWYHGQRSFEIEPTADSLAIIGQAVAAGWSMWKPNTRYAKAGVILLDLQAEGDAPRDLLPTTDPVRSEKLMTALDAVNARFGRGTLRPGGIRQVTP